MILIQLLFFHIKFFGEYPDSSSNSQGSLIQNCNQTHPFTCTDQEIFTVQNTTRIGQKDKRGNSTCKLIKGISTVALNAL